MSTQANNDDGSRALSSLPGAAAAPTSHTAHCQSTPAKPGRPVIWITSPSQSATKEASFGSALASATTAPIADSPALSSAASSGTAPSLALSILSNDASSSFSFSSTSASSTSSSASSSLSSATSSLFSSNSSPQPSSSTAGTADKLLGSAGSFPDSSPLDGLIHPPFPSPGAAITLADIDMAASVIAPTRASPSRPKLSRLNTGDKVATLKRIPSSSPLPFHLNQSTASSSSSSSPATKGTDAGFLHHHGPSIAQGGTATPVPHNANTGFSTAFIPSSTSRSEDVELKTSRPPSLGGPGPSSPSSVFTHLSLANHAGAPSATDLLHPTSAAYASAIPGSMASATSPISFCATTASTYAASSLAAVHASHPSSSSGASSPSSIHPPSDLSSSVGSNRTVSLSNRPSLTLLSRPSPAPGAGPSRRPTLTLSPLVTTAANTMTLPRGASSAALNVCASSPASIQGPTTQHITSSPTASFSTTSSLLKGHPGTSSEDASSSFSLSDPMREYGGRSAVGRRHSRPGSSSSSSSSVGSGKHDLRRSAVLQDGRLGHQPRLDCSFSASSVSGAEGGGSGSSPFPSAVEMGSPWSSTTSAQAHCGGSPFAESGTYDEGSGRARIHASAISPVAGDGSSLTYSPRSSPPRGSSAQLDGTTTTRSLGSSKRSAFAAPEHMDRLRRSFVTSPLSSTFLGSSEMEILASASSFEDGLSSSGGGGGMMGGRGGAGPQRRRRSGGEYEPAGPGRHGQQQAHPLAYHHSQQQGYPRAGHHHDAAAAAAAPPHPHSAYKTPATSTSAPPALNPTPIIPDLLYLGPAPSHATHWAELRALGVKRVLNVAEEVDLDVPLQQQGSVGSQEGEGEQQGSRQCQLNSRGAVRAAGAMMVESEPQSSSERLPPAGAASGSGTKLDEGAERRGTLMESSESNAEAQVLYKKVGIRDHVEEERVEDMLREGSEFLNEGIRAQEPTYVHCLAGRSRSPTAIIAYLIRYRSWSFDRAYEFVRELRGGGSVAAYKSRRDDNDGGGGAGRNDEARDARSDAVMDFDADADGLVAVKRPGAEKEDEDERSNGMWLAAPQGGAGQHGPWSHLSRSAPVSATGLEDGQLPHQQQQRQGHSHLSPSPYAPSSPLPSPASGMFYDSQDGDGGAQRACQEAAAGGGSSSPPTWAAAAAAVSAFATHSYHASNFAPNIGFVAELRRWEVLCRVEASSG